jgi:radical SAM superfamily enzyme YgiQ (UPF0313 family)
MLVRKRRLMKKTGFSVLLINPPIADFAAHDMWAAPVGLMRIAVALGASGIEYNVADFLGEGFTEKTLPDGRRRYRKSPFERDPALAGLEIPRRLSIYGATPDEMDAALGRIARAPDLTVISTMMTYWYPGVVEAHRAVRRRFPGTNIVIGGVYASILPGHARSAMPGLRVFTNADLSGFDKHVSELSGRPFDCFSDGFRNWPNPATGPFPGRKYIPVSLVRGCPFRCGYCAGPLLVPGIQSADPVNLACWVTDEVRRTGIRHLALMDDAFLMNGARHAKPFMRALEESGEKVEFHAPNGLHPRWIDAETAQLMKAVNFSTIRLSLETVDRELAASSSGKVEVSELEEALNNLAVAGYERGGIGVYLIAGLPGQTPDDVMRSIRHVESLGAAAYLPEYSPIPGTPLFDAALSIAKADINEPLLQNNSLLSCWHPAFPWSVMQELKDAARGTRAAIP